MFTNDAFTNLCEQVREDVADFAAGRRGVPTELGFSGHPSAFIAMTHRYPIVTMRFNTHSARRATVNYSYVKESKERCEWEFILSLEIDAAEQSFITVGDRKFDAVSRLSEFLLQPLSDPNFTPPECT